VRAVLWLRPMSGGNEVPGSGVGGGIGEGRWRAARNSSFVEGSGGGDASLASGVSSRGVVVEWSGRGERTE